MTTTLKTFFLLVLILFGLNGCNWQKEETKLLLAENLLGQGELSKAEEVVKEFISNQLTNPEKTKIDSILDICHRIRIDFALSEKDVLRKLQAFDTSFTQEKLHQLENEHKVDFRVLDGQKRYFKNCVSNIFRLDAECAMLKNQKKGIVIDSLSIFRLSHTAEIVQKSAQAGKTVGPVKMKLSYTITVKAGAVPAGETIRCWMPFPRESNPRQQEIRLIKTFPENHLVSPASDLQRTLYLEQVSQNNQPTVFHTEIDYTSFAQSFQLNPGMIKPYNKESQIYKEFTTEKPPQIIFNSNIKSLSDKILQGETNPLLKVKKIYKWINDSVTWASALEYSIMPDIPGFVIQNRHGDCGMQTLLFMTLSRYSGIPVKWQSGWMLHPGHVNLHDWCEVWYEGIGWVPLDQSFGLQDSQEDKIREFYTTGMDAYRLIVNDDISQPLTPSKKFLRSEPYDFQRGELEWKGGNLYFDQWNWDMEVTYE